MRIQFQTIVAATDLSEPSNHAIRQSVALAREFQSRLLICHVIDLPAPSMYGEAYLAPEEHLNRNLDHARRHIDEMMSGQEVRWEPRICVGQPAEEVDRIAREDQAQMVITATHGRRGLKRLLLGSVTERLMRTLPCPLLVVRGDAQAPEQLPESAIRFKRILVGCDFSPDADLALQHALSLAQEFESELHLAHVIEMPTYTDRLRPVFEHRRSSTSEIKTFMQEKLDALIPQEARHWCRASTVMLEGQPYAQLLQYASQSEIDLIVLGTRGHGVIDTMLIGSTTDRVIRRATCAVFSVSPQTQAAMT
ncbi:MAG: universal stress protein [Desulfobacterales bacterium]|nr:universal stress protein [Desulfobacterales bacterium]